MAILIRCKCGKAVKVKDSAAGTQIECPDCFIPIRVPGTKKKVARTDNDEPDFDAAVEMAKDSEAFDDAAEVELLADLGALAKKPADCPWCGKAVSRAATQCRHCHKSFRAGACARCGETNEPQKKACKCGVRPVIWGRGQFLALCTNCGRNLTSARRWGTSCPWCESAAMCAKLLPNTKTSGLSDEKRLANMRRVVESLESRVKQAGGGLVNGFLGMFGSVILTSLSGGMPVSALSGEQDLPETEQLFALSRSTLLRLHDETKNRYAAPLERIQLDPIKQSLLSVAVVVVGIVLLIVLVRVFTSGGHGQQPAQPAAPAQPPQVSSGIRSLPGIVNSRHDAPIADLGVAPGVA